MDVPPARPGTTIEFELTEDGRGAVLTAGRPARKRSPFARLRGVATQRMTTDAVMKLTRGDA